MLQAPHLRSIINTCSPARSRRSLTDLSRCERHCPQCRQKYTRCPCCSLQEGHRERCGTGIGVTGSLGASDAYAYAYISSPSSPPPDSLVSAPPLMTASPVPLDRPDARRGDESCSKSSPKEAAGGDPLALPCDAPMTFTVGPAKAT